MALGGFAPLPLRLGGTPEDGVTAAQYLRLCADLVAARRVAPFCVMTVDQNSNSPTITNYRGQNGVGINDRPSISWNGAMTVITFASLYLDDKKTVVPMRLTSAKGTLIGSTAGGRVKVLHVYEPNIIRVAPVDMSGAALSTAKYLLVIR